MLNFQLLRQVPIVVMAPAGHDAASMNTNLYFAGLMAILRI
jgi:hypothetical protein